MEYVDKVLEENLKSFGSPHPRDSSANRQFTESNPYLLKRSNVELSEIRTLS